MNFINKYLTGGSIETKKPLIKKKSYKEMTFKEKMEVDMKDEKSGRSTSGAGAVKPITKKK